jgi:hypothetical protein
VNPSAVKEKKINYERSENVALGLALRAGFIINSVQFSGFKARRYSLTLLF